MLYRISVTERGLTGIANIFRSRLSRLDDLLGAGTVPLIKCLAGQILFNGYMYKICETNLNFKICEINITPLKQLLVLTNKALTSMTNSNGYLYTLMGDVYFCTILLPGGVLQGKHNLQV